MRWPNSVFAAKWASMCSGCGLSVSRLNIVLSISVTVRVSACLNSCPTLKSSKYSPAMVILPNRLCRRRNCHGPGALFCARRIGVRQVYGLALPELRDFFGGKSGLAEDLASMLAKRRGRPAGFGLGRAPGRRHLHLPDASFDGVLDRFEEADGCEVRIVENGFQRMH